jgi:aminoglycoside phosphotransferase
MGQPTAPLPAPASLQPWLSDAEWQPVTISMSGAQVYQILAPSEPARYLKLAAAPYLAELQDEHARLLWLRGRLPIPSVLAWAEEAGRGWLLLTEAPGVMVCDPAVSADPARVTRLLAEGLRRIHSLPIADCPFDMRATQRLALAAGNIRLGIVAPGARLDGKSISPERLLAHLTATRPPEPDADLVFVHGDYCLPNVLLGATGVSAWLDWGRAGVSDRYQDLAIGARSVRYNLGAEWAPRFMAAYGSEPLDQRRLAWYEALDELF